MKICGSKNLLLLSSWLQNKFFPLTFIAVRMQCVGDKCVDVSTVRYWVLQFKQEMGEGQGGQWWQLSLIRNMLKKWVEKIVKSKRNWESLKKGWATLTAFYDSEKFLPIGYCENWWDASWKSHCFKEISGPFWRESWGISVVDSHRWWNLGPSLWYCEQKAVYGILPYRITSAK
jgi:hypothetical protein